MPCGPPRPSRRAESWTGRAPRSGSRRSAAVTAPGAGPAPAAAGARPPRPAWPSRSGWSGSPRTIAGWSNPGPGRGTRQAREPARGRTAAAHRRAGGRYGSPPAVPFRAGHATADRCHARAAAAAPGSNRTTESPQHWTLSALHLDRTVAGMSTLTAPASSDDTDRGRAAGRIISGPLALLFLSTFGALTSFYLLLSATPMYAAAAGSGSTGAGLVTGVLLLGTVAAELSAPFLMKRYAYRTLLIIGAVLLGVPSLDLLVRGSLLVIVTASVIRGFGFGLSTVIAGALTAMLLPPDRRGEGLGLFGVVATAPGVVALPAGVWLAGHTGMASVIVMAAATALVPLTVFPWLAGRPGTQTQATAST